MLKRAKNLGKIGGSLDFQSKWINFNAEKGKKFGQNRGQSCESILMLKGKKFGQKGGSHDFQSKWINFNAKKGKKFGQNRG